MLKKMINLPINEVMSTNVVTVEPFMIMTKVAEIFETNSFHHIPVVDDGKLLGIISKHDYNMLLVSETKLQIKGFEKNNDKWLQALTAKDVMTKNPVCLHPNDSTSEALNLFLENQYHAILICEDGRLLGIVTPFDLLKLLKETVENS